MNRPDLSRTRLSALALFALVALIAAGCGGGSGGTSGSSGAEATPKAGGTLRISQGGEAVNIDPLESTEFSSINVISQIVEPLFKLNAEEELEPWLATKVEKSKDERVWTLGLRQGVKFSNGQPLTSADVLFTLEEARKSLYWESLLAGIEKVEAPSPSTIVITNSKPAPELEVTLSQWSFGIVPKDLGGMTEKEFAEHPIGTGPFVLGPWKHGESITLEKNRDYWEKDRPYLDKVVFQTVNSPESRVAQLKGGQLEAIVEPPYSQLEAIESTPGLKVGNYPMGFVQFLILNSRDPLFQNEKVREAVELAVDREGLNAAALSGHGELAGAWVPPAVPNSAADVIEPATRDVEKAKALLAEAEKEGIDPSFTLVSSTENSYWRSGAQIVQQNLEDIGLKLKIETMEGSSLLEVLGSGKFDMATLEVYPSTPGPAELFSYYNATESLYTGVDATEMTKLAEQAVSTPNAQKREGIWHQMQENIKDEQFILPLTYSPYVWALQEDVSGFAVTLTGIPWLADTGFTK
jgi:peptide/nickel transport system substrate-binding protein